MRMKGDTDVRTAILASLESARQRRSFKDRFSSISVHMAKQSLKLFDVEGDGSWLFHAIAQQKIGTLYAAFLRKMTSDWLMDIEHVVECLTLLEPQLEIRDHQDLESRLNSFILRAGKGNMGWEEFCHVFSKDQKIPAESIHMVALGILLGYNITVHLAFEGKYIESTYICQESESYGEGKEILSKHPFKLQLVSTTSEMKTPHVHLASDGSHWQLIIAAGLNKPETFWTVVPLKSKLLRNSKPFVAPRPLALAASTTGHARPAVLMVTPAVLIESPAVPAKPKPSAVPALPSHSIASFQIPTTPTSSSAAATLTPPDSPTNDTNEELTIESDDVQVIERPQHRVSDLAHQIFAVEMKGFSSLTFETHNELKEALNVVTTRYS